MITQDFFIPVRVITQKNIHLLFTALFQIYAFVIKLNASVELYAQNGNKNIP